MIEVIEVGRHEEKWLMDFVDAGSKVAELMFELGLLSVLKKGNAKFRVVAQLEQDTLELAAVVRERVIKIALKELGQ